MDFSLLTKKFDDHGHDKGDFEVADDDDDDDEKDE